LYGDHFRSPGRDDRQDGAEQQSAPWESAFAPSGHDDVKVAGSPISQSSTPDANATGEYDPGAYDSYAEPVIPFDGETTVTDAPAVTSMYETGPGTPPPPAFGGAEPAGPDFEDMRRTPHASGKKKLIRVAAVAAAVVVIGGGGAAWAVSGGGSSSSKETPQAQAQEQQAPAPLTDAQRKDAEARRQKELKKRAARAARDDASRPKLVAKGTPPPTKSPSPAGGAGDPVPAGEAQRIARAMLPSYGWTPSSQFGCLVNLWNRESHWNVHASNPSGAYGIAQAKPGSKMASAGPDWQNNATTQIKWGLGYIKDRYGSPCGAWAHSQSTGWY
jgi:hypothetical protein